MNYLQTAAWNHVIAQAVILQERAEMRRVIHAELTCIRIDRILLDVDCARYVQDDELGEALYALKRSASDAAKAHHDAEIALALAHTLREMQKIIALESVMKEKHVF